jgi:hypothetical protein
MMIMISIRMNMMVRTGQEIFSYPHHLKWLCVPLSLLATEGRVHITREVKEAESWS